MLHDFDVLGTFVRIHAHDIAAYEGALEGCTEGESPLILDWGRPPRPRVQVHGALMDCFSALPRPTELYDVDAPCCFLNGAHGDSMKIMIVLRCYLKNNYRSILRHFCHSYLDK